MDLHFRHQLAKSAIQLFCGVNVVGRLDSPPDDCDTEVLARL